MEEKIFDLSKSEGKVSRSVTYNGTYNFEVTLQWRHATEGGSRVNAQAKIEFNRVRGRSPETSGTLVVDYRIARSNGRAQAYQKIQKIRYQEHPKYAYLEVRDNELKIVDLSYGIYNEAFHELSNAVALFGEFGILLRALRRKLK